MSSCESAIGIGLGSLRPEHSQRGLDDFARLLEKVWPASPISPDVDDLKLSESVFGLFT
jgi:hypothetical protein